MGTGIKRMKDLMREAGLKEPEFTSDTFFHAVFYRNPEYSLKRARELGNEKTVEKTREKTREKILALIAEHPHITTNELAKELSITSKGVEWNLKQLRASGLVRRVGPDKGGQWEVSGGKL